MTHLKVPYQKQASTAEVVLRKLQTQGLVVAPRSQQMALAYLRGVGAYRLKGYWHHFADPTTKRFRAGVTFDVVIERCEFDRELRGATTKAIEHLEVAVRAAIADTLSLKHSPHWFLRPEIFKPTREWGMGQLVKKIEDEVRRADGKRFIEHYLSRHDDPYLPPSWAVSECISFGFWSRTYAVLRDAADKKAIARRFAIDEPDVFKSWIHSLSVIRNLVAHHGQVLRVKLGVAPANYKKAGIRFSDQKSFFAMATVIAYLLRQTRLPNTWISDLEVIFSRYPTVSPTDLGFPPTWKSEPGWL